jgi:uncharacterized protein YndB with AHSA1/START domain
MTNPQPLPYSLERTVVIQAPRDTVFAYFEDSSRWAAWWGAGSTIDPRPGGKVYVRHPGAVEASGEIVEIVRPQKIVFTYGYASGKPIGPGESLVTIVLEPAGGGTRLTLRHDLAEESARNEHVQGWRFQLSLFANLIANDQHRDSTGLADAWFAAWAEPDDAKRRAGLTAIAAPDVTFGDRYSTLAGIDDLVAHAGAAQRFMPGMRLQRAGPARHCLGVALVDWVVNAPDGTPKAKGTNVFTLAADGRIAGVVGIWD